MAKKDDKKDTDAKDKTDDKNIPPTPSADDKKTEAKTEKVLVIVSKREGFRRAGYAFGADETVLKFADLSKEQVKMLKSEPMLVVNQTERKI